MPIVSLIIPCYNQGRFVDEAVSSVLEQTFQDFEIIIVNDGSTDNETNQLLQGYNHPKSRVVTTKNQGLAAARNNGIKAAQGKYILPLDADDRIGPTYMEQAVQLLGDQEQLGIVYCRAQLFGAVDTEWLLPDFSLEQMLLDNVIFCSAMFRRSDWQQVDGYDETLRHGWEDYDFWLSLLEMGRKVYRIPEILFYYRVSADSMVRARPRQHKLESFVQIFHKHQSLYSENICIWIDKLLDVREQYHEAELLVQGPDGRHSVEQFVRKVDTSTSRLEFQLPADKELGELIFNVADDYVAVRIHGITIENHGSNLLLEGWTSNADVIENDLFMFCNDIPALQLNLSEDDTLAGTGGKLVILLNYLAFGRDCLSILLDVQRAKQETPANMIQPEARHNDPAAPIIPVSWWGVNKALIKRRLKYCKYFLTKHYRTIKKRGLLDSDFYRQNDLQMNPLLVDPLIHYVETGWREGRNPNPLFEANWYQKTYKVLEDQDPLLHYIQEGQQTGNNPNLLFFTSYYAEKYPESICNGQSPLSHYLHQGWQEGNNPNPCFDTSYYLKQNHDVVELGQNPLFHYYHTGNREQRSPMPFFDMRFYCEDNPKALEEWLFPLLHYYEYGAAEGRSPNRLFDPEYYKTTYHLSELSGIDLFLHYVNEGAGNEYRPSTLFDPAYYAEAYPEYRETHSFPLSHYQEIGVYQGLYPCSEVAGLDKKPVISILTPVFNTNELLLRKCIHSVLYQAYPHWELCLVDDGSSADHIQPLLEEYAEIDSRIKISLLKKNQGIADATNEAGKLVTGEYIGFLDHDDELTLNALYEMVLAINLQDPDILYSDEDLIDNESRYTDSFFKPDFNPELLLCHNFITHFLITRRSLYDAVGGLSSDYNGAQDYDLLLKLTEISNKVYHISKVLYHWRATETSTSINHTQKDYANEAGLHALQAAVRRRGLQAEIHPGLMNYFYEFHRHLNGKPSVDLFILLKNGGEDAEAWLATLLQKTHYPNLAVYLIPYTSLPSDVEERLKNTDNRVAVLSPVSNGNFALALNKAAQEVDGEFLCFLAQGILPKDSTWLESFLGYAQEKEIGVVGGLVTDRNNDQNNDFLPDISDNSSLAYHYFLTQTSAHANGLFCPQEVIAVSSEFCMVQRELFAQTGGFDDTMFPTLLFDVDFCFHLQQLGFHHIFTPYSSAMYGNGSISLKSRSGSGSEKVHFQRKWQEKLLSGNPFVNPQMILDQESIVEKEWWVWLTGRHVSEEKP